MHTITKRIVSVINLTLLQASTIFADRRSVIPYLLRLRWSVARLSSCLSAVRRVLEGCSSYRPRDTALACTYMNTVGCPRVVWFIDWLHRYIMTLQNSMLQHGRHKNIHVHRCTWIFLWRPCWSIEFCNVIDAHLSYPGRLFIRPPTWTALAGM